MPGDADELGNGVLTSLKSLEQSMAMRAGRGGYGRRLNLPGRAKSLVSSMLGRMGAEFESDMNDLYETVMGEKGRRYAFAETEDEIDQIAAALESEGIEYSVLAPPANPGNEVEGLWRIEAKSLEQVDAASKGLREMMREHSLRNVVNKMALERAVAEAADELASQPSVGQPAGTKSFDFKTLDFDPDATYMEKQLADLLSKGYPEGAVAKQALGNGFVRFSVPAAAAPAVRELADALSQTVRSMGPERFVFPDDFAGPSQAPKTVQQVAVETEQEALQIRSQLELAGIDYHVEQEAPQGPLKFTIASTPDQAQALSDNLRALQEIEAPAVEAVVELQDAHEAANRQVADREGARTREAVRNALAREKREIEKITPAIDRAAAKEMADAYNLGKELRDKTQTVSRGRQ